ncbi:toxin-antitoxin system YwqK family antitoxin [Pseudomonas aeruginosa]|nr:toxin-antitoxin system YwqK family antitoxin [Pseudomonas aeruginosa]MCO3818119.1 toxin-antitoxin system YwqK family antitoxin [Pseudomonas aeruginosa]
MKQLLPALLAISGITFMASGCSDPTLDYRNAQFSNGIIYDAQDNTPFTGLITNLPNERQAFDLKLQDTLAAINKTVDHYGGKAQAFYYRSLICNSEVIDGYLAGLTTCFMPNSNTKRYTANYNGGRLDGEFEVYAVDGSTVLAKGQFKDGSPEGELNIYGPNNGRLVRRSNTANGVLDGLQEQWDEGTGKLVSRAKAANGQYVGLYETWSVDGVKTLEIPFVNGMRNGIARAWDPATGTLTEEVTYVDNAMDGPSKKWSSDGTLIKSGTYKRNAFYEDPTPDEVASQASQAPDDAPAECIDLWIKAYHTEKGEDTSISSAQLGEWSNWCDEGKRP